MQRRAVAVYVAFFVLIATASYALIATAEEPTITLEEADFELAEGEEFTVGDQTYTVTEIEQTEDEEDGSTTFAGTLEWVEEDVEMTESWANGDTVEISDTTWEVQIDDEANASTSFSLVEVLDRQAILEADPNADDQLVDRDGEEYVVVQSNGDDELVPAEEYFDEPATITYSEGDRFVYNDQTVTVSELTDADVTITWLQDETNSDDLQQGELIELADGNEYLTFFPGQNTVMLTQDTTSYDAQVESQHQFADRIEGLTYTIVTSMLFVFSLVAFAFLPSRY